MAKNPAFAVIDAPAEVFKFKLVNDDTLYELPTLQSLPMRKYQDLTGVAEDEIKFTNMCAEIFDDYCAGLVDKLTVKEFSEITSAWYKASGITLGE